MSHAMMLNRRSGVTRALAIVAALAALIVLAAAAPSQASAATYEFQPVRLIVHDIEDGWPDWKDEPIMYYSDQVWADVVANKETVEGWRIPRATFTGTQMQIDLWERDNGWYPSNMLGTVWITPGALNDERTVRFGGPGAWYHYELVYKVVQIA